jgi:hypothetical protein
MFPELFYSTGNPDFLPKIHLGLKGRKLKQKQPQGSRNSMSGKRRKDRNENVSEIVTLDLSSGKKADNCSKFESDSETQGSKSGIFAYLKTHLWVVGIIAFLALGALGAGLKYLDESARQEIALRAKNKGGLNRQNDSFLNKINPFLSNTDPTPTPQLSKEYIYAGSRLLAVEDADATVAPPADLAIWRPDTGYWWVMKPDGNVQAAVGWGQLGDEPVEGDYDGDGKTDFAVYRPAASSTSGTWWIMRSSDSSYFSTTLGGVNDRTAQADYDGDGKTDVAVFRPSTGVWYILQSSDQQTVQGQFGLNDDVPTPADFDGDGRADIAVWRNSETNFYSKNSSNGAVQIPPSMGQSGEPVPADYDGDGRANYAVRNGANWLIMNSSFSQVQTTSWQSGGKAVQNDYDGDGKVDIAVWNAGTWYIRQSAFVGQTNELRQVQWGIAGDIPVPAFYRR